MKKFMIIAAVLFTTLPFFACNNAPDAPASVPQVKKEVTPAPPPQSDRFAFKVKTVKVENPLEVSEGSDDGGDWISISYLLSFTDSTGTITKNFGDEGEYPKWKPSSKDTADLAYYTSSLNSYNSVKKLYKEIKKTPAGMLFVKGEGNFIKRITRGADTLWSDPYFDKK